MTQLLNICLALILVSSLFADRCLSQSAEEHPLSLEQCIAAALEKNPSIQAAAQRHYASLERIGQATAYPYPSIDYVSDFQPQFLNFFKAGETYLGLSQTLELPRKREARGNVARSEAREVEVDIDVVRLDVAFQVKCAFYQLLLAEEKLALARRDVELSDDYLEKARLKLAAGEVAEVEVLRARIESLKAANSVRVASNEVSQAKARLNFFMGRTRAAPIEVRGDLALPFLDMSLDQLKREAFEQRPELRKMGAAIETQQRVQERARLSSWPDFGVNLSPHLVRGDPTSWSFTLSVPLPFLFPKRQRAEIAEAQANVAAIRKDLEQAQNAIALEVEEALLSAQTAQSEIVLHQQEILPQAQKAYEMFLFSYQEGEIGGIELIEARRTLNEARKTFAQALSDYAVALAGVQRAVGRQP
jgi:cobalt-zinc-cadmium efflux system outer membrane protein